MNNIIQKLGLNLELDYFKFDCIKEVERIVKEKIAEKEKTNEVNESNHENKEE